MQSRQHGGLPGRDPTLGCRLLQQRQHAPLHRGVADRMVDDQPGGLGAIFADLVLARPAELLDDGLQASHIAVMHALQQGVVALPQAAVTRQLGTQIRVLAGKSKELLAERWRTQPHPTKVRAFAPPH